MEEWHLNLWVQSFCSPAPELGHSFPFPVSDAAAPPAGPAAPESSSNTLSAREASGRVAGAHFPALSKSSLGNRAARCYLSVQRQGQHRERGMGQQRNIWGSGMASSGSWQGWEQIPAHLNAPSLLCLLTPQTLDQHKPNWCMCTVLSFTMLMPAVQITAQQPSPSQNNP